MPKKLIRGNACERKWEGVGGRLEEPSDHSVSLTLSVGRREGREDGCVEP